MKKILFFLSLTLSIIVSSQDLITFRNGTRLECEIIKTDDLNVHYRFSKNERTIETFTAKHDISTYQFNYKEEIINSLNENAKIVIDTVRYAKEISHWVNLITYTPGFGINSKGWSLHYRGFQLSTNSKWSIPISFLLDFQELKEELLYQSGYLGISMLYYQAGISPIRKLNDYVYLNLGASLIYGSENLISNSNNETQSTLFGLSAQQGLLLFPSSKFGICLGISVFQKLLSSQVYRNDMGVKFDFGLKF